MTCRSHHSLRSSVAATAVSVVLVVLAVSGCSANDDAPGAVRAATVPPVPTTVALSTVPLTTSPTTTAPPTTPAPTTTEAEPTPETTAAAPVDTTPANVVPVARAAEPIQAVGTSSGEATRAVQARLIELGFWVSGVDGTYGLTTRQAVMAFQKYWGLSATGSVDQWTAAFLTGMDQRARGLAESGDLVEVDKSRQILFIVKNGITVWVLNASTGSEIPYETVNKKDPSKIERGSSITPVGTHEVYRQRAEGWWDGDLGSIYRPKYFIGGVAIHGSNSVPNYPASHGCVRVSVPAMDMIWDTGLVPLKSTVWVHGEIPAGRL
jgi:peptidoglycan hydrolase-like protein with peptidoglycan-binding domain